MTILAAEFVLSSYLSSYLKQSTMEKTASSDPIPMKYFLGGNILVSAV